MYQVVCQGEERRYSEVWREPVKGAPPMRQAVMIRSLPRAFAMIKAMQDQGYEWGEDYRQSGREALVEILEEQVGVGHSRRSQPPRPACALSRRPWPVSSDRWACTSRA